MNHDVIVIGASAGGVEALRTIVRDLPSDLAAAVLIVLHLNPKSPSLLPTLLQTDDGLRVAHSIDGLPVEPRTIYVAPPDHHLLIYDKKIMLSRGPKENRTRPAIDPLFRSAAIEFGPRVIGVVLTGYLDDGTAGLQTIKAYGGIGVVQDPADAPYPEMPENARRYAAPDHVLPLKDIAPLLVRLVSEQAGTGDLMLNEGTHVLETRFATLASVSMDEMDRLGPRSELTCPECNGLMWKLKHGEFARYRCHTGHAYSAKSLLEEHAKVQEVQLWQVFRLMKERMSLLVEQRCIAQHEAREGDAAKLEEEIRRLQVNMDTLEQMLERG